MTPRQQWQQIGGETNQRGKENKWCNHCKSWVYHNSDKCYMLEKNKHHNPPWYNNLMNPNGMEKGQNHDGDRGPNSTVQAVIAVAT